MIPLRGPRGLLRGQRVSNMGLRGLRRSPKRYYGFISGSK